jgi:hypothetical protein
MRITPTSTVSVTRKDFLHHCTVSNSSCGRSGHSRVHDLQKHRASESQQSSICREGWKLRQEWTLHPEPEFLLLWETSGFALQTFN